MPGSEEFFKWSAEYSVQIAIIDEQHKELVNILNRLFVAVSRLEGDIVIAGILKALTDYTRTHFALEEQLLRMAQYEDFDAHKDKHRKLIEKLEALREKHAVEEKSIYFEMLSFLRAWLKEHIQGEDMKYSKALRENGFSMTEWEREANKTFARLSEDARGPWWKRWGAA